MKKLEIKITSHQSVDGLVMKIDGKIAKFKKNSFDNLVCYHQTEQNNVHIELYRLIDVGGPIWFIVQLIFFLISIFGLFDVHRKESCLSIEADFDIELKDIENSVIFMINRQQNVNGKALDVDSNQNVIELSNRVFLDEKAKKKLKKLKISKIVLALLVIAAAIIATVFIIIN